MPATPLLQEPDLPPITLRSPGDLVAITPYLLGFHPASSIVVLGFHRGRSVFALRGDLPGPQGQPTEVVAGDLIAMVVRQQATSVALIGYGPAHEVDPILQATRELAGQRRLDIMDVIRVDANRWWSYLCERPTCCPPEGTLIDLTTSEVAAHCTFAGLSALPAREELVRQVAPVEGLARVSMSQATDRAEARLAEMLADLAEPDWAPRVSAEGTAAVTEAIRRYGDGGSFSDDEMAWLTLLLTSTQVRDHAWEAITTEEPHLRLWSDATRRVEPALVPAPASLLAFAAWRRGDGTLAQIALGRALQADPSYSMALLLQDGLVRGLPPSVFDGWGTPAWAERLDREVRAHTRRRRRRGRSGGSRRRG